jgi:hypothetical protein
MTDMPPKALVPAPAGLPLAYGLFSVVAPIENSALRWENGVCWEDPTAIGEVRTIGSWNDSGTVEGLPKHFDSRGGVAESFNPFTVYTSSAGTPVGASVEELQAQVEARLLAREEIAVETILWGGYGGVGSGAFWGATEVKQTATGASDLPLVDALAVIDALASKWGVRPTIHVSRRAAAVLMNAKAVESQGARLVTKLGSPVVAGTGYGDQPYIVASGPLVLYRGPVLTSENRPGDTMDRRQNHLYQVAERTYAAGVDKRMTLKIKYEAMPAVKIGG